MLSFAPVNFSLFPDTPQMEADLRLAAAAPQLLEALKALRELIRGTEVAANCNCNVITGKVCPIEQAERVILAAEGRE